MLNLADIKNFYSDKDLTRFEYVNGFSQETLESLVEELQKINHTYES